MIALRFDMRDFERAARGMGILATDQVPFAIAKTLNDAMLQPGATRDTIVNRTFPASFHVRRGNFARAAFNVEMATKGKLSAALFDRLHRGSLDLHADGGTKTPRQANLAIPNQQRIRLTASGARPRPRAIRVKNARRALRVLPGKGIFVGEGGELHALYWFKRSASIRQEFPFYEDFARTTTREVRARFPANMQRAFDTAFK